MNEAKKQKSEIEQLKMFLLEFSKLKWNLNTWIRIWIQQLT
jgi:hypothetical protein